MHNGMLAHGRGVQAFRAAGSPGEIGVVLDIWKREPATQAPADVALAQQGEDDGFRFFLDALRGGGYSPLPPGGAEPRRDSGAVDGRRRILERFSGAGLRTPDSDGPQDQRERVRDALLALPHRQRALVVLYHFEDRPLSEAGDLVGLTPGSAKVAMHRARKRLQLELGASSAAVRGTGFTGEASDDLPRDRGRPPCARTCGAVARRCPSTSRRRSGRSAPAPRRSAA